MVQSVVQRKRRLLMRVIKVCSGVAGANFAIVGCALARNGLVMDGVQFWKLLVGTLAGSLHRDIAISNRADAVENRVQVWAWSLCGSCVTLVATSLLIVNT